jgi:hypothetical protein
MGMRINETTPKAITPAILELAKKLSAMEESRYVPVTLARQSGTTVLPY